MSKARDLADFQGSASALTTGTLPVDRVPYVGRKNLIINGDMQVWQRGTSHTTAAGYQSVDRWQFNTYIGGAFTVSKEIDSVHGPYLKWNRTSVDTARPSAGNAIEQSIENARYIIGGKQVTVSFWLKDEAGLGSGFVRLRQAASPYADVTDGQQTWVSSSSDWEYHTFTFNVDSASSIGMDHVELLIRLDDGTATGGVSITKVQLELGSVATPFEHRSYGEELALCQRYYQEFAQNELSFTFDAASSPAVGNSYMSRRYTTLLCPMRSSPTVTVTSLNHGLTGAPLVYGTPQVLCVSTHLGGYNNGNNPYVYISCTLDSEL